MRLVWFWVAVLGLALVPGQAKAAQSGGPGDRNLADRTCGVFPAQMGPEELLWLKWEFVNSAPAAYSAELRAIDFITSEDVTTLGPVFIPGRNARIELNPGFLRDLCYSVMLQDYAAIRTDHDFSSYRQALARCIASRNEPLACFRMGTLNLFSSRQLEEFWFYSEASFRDSTVTSTNSVASYLIAHEAAHLIFRSPRSGTNLSQLDEEYEADIYAYLTVLDGQSMFNAVMSPFATQSLIDEAMPEAPLATHGSSLCRLQRTREVVRRVMAEAFAMNVLALDPYNEQKLQLVPAEWTDRFSRRRLASASWSGNCDEALDDRLNSLLADISDIVTVFTANLRSPTEPRRNLSGIREITDIKYRTLAGRRMGFLIAISAFNENPAIWRTNYEAVRGDPVAGVTSSEVTRYYALRRETFDDDLAEFLNATETVKFSSPRITMAYGSHPPGTSISAANRQLMAGMEQLEALVDFREWAAAEWQRVHRLDEREARFEEVSRPIASLMKFKLTAAVALGDCALAAEIVEFAATSLRMGPQSLDFSDRSACLRRSEELRADQAANFGWKP